jgi:hypothetical protein
MAIQPHPTRKTPPSSKMRGRILLAALALALGGAQPAWFVDAVTAASDTSNPPEMTLSTPSGSPSISKNVINAKEGEPVNIDIKVYDTANTVGYTSFDLEAKPANFPPGATLTFDPSKGEGHYTWTPQAGDAQNYPSATVTFVAKNTYFQTTTQEKVLLVLGDASAPAFSSTIPAKKAVQVKTRLKFPITVTSTSPKLKIKAQRLPKGAILGPTKKGGAGRWVAVMTWKPKAKQDGKQYNTTFTAIARNNGQVQQATLAVMFESALVPCSYGKALAMNQASWDAASSTYTVSGTGPAKEAVTLGFRQNGEPLTSVPIAADCQGNWTYTGKVDDANNAPCGIRATVGSDVASKPLANADPNSCVKSPACTEGTWYPADASGMGAMCM